MSYSAELSNSFNRDVQGYLQSPEYQELFPETQLPVKNQGTKLTQHEFKLEQGGYLISTSVGGQLTGRSLDYGIVDDCYKGREEANSETISNKTWEWFNGVFMSRFKDTGKQLLLFTRWSEDDIAGRLLAEYPDQWELIRLPALADEDYLNNIDGTKPPEDPRKTVDEALWPTWHGTKKLQQVREQSPMVFACLYQQNPSPSEGNIIHKSWFTIVDREKHFIAPMTWNFFVDPAYTSKHENDPSSILVAGFDGANMYIKRVTTVRKELPDLVRFIEKFAREEGYTNDSRIYIEPQASGHSVIQALNAETDLNVLKWKFPKVNNTRMHDKDKVTRAYAVTGKLESDRVKLIKGHWNDSFLHECSAFPNSKRDDQVDVLVFAIFHYFFKKKMRGIKINNRRHV